MVMNKRIIIGVLIALFVNLGNAQTPKKFWVKLNNKNGTPYSVSTPTAFLTQKSIDRRTNQGIAINQSDLPVDPAYIAAIDNITDVQVLYASKWMNAIVVAITNTNTSAIQTATNAIASQSFVVSTSPTNKLKVVLGKVDELQQSNLLLEKANNIVKYYGVGFWQAEQLNAVCLHGYGYRGQGMTIAVLDAGFNKVDQLHAFDSLFARNGIKGTRDFVTGGNSVYEDNSHGMMVLSCMAACVPSVMVGTAPEADYWLLRTEDAATETPSEEYNWIRGAEFADSVGADILTTSLGYTNFDNSAFDHVYSSLNGKTYPMSIAATMAVRKGMFVLNSAGNDGQSAWQFIGVPADADSICTVGAIDSVGAYASFSSKGPTADGRRKPDLVAKGQGAWVANTGDGFNPGNGTSFSCPILAGAVACFWQRHNTFTVRQVLDTLRKTASNVAAPNNFIGWGRPNMCALPVGLKELSSDPATFKISPNPTKDKFTIKVIEKKYDILNAEIYNMMGCLIKMLSITTNETAVDMSSFANGVYFVKITTRGGSSTLKLVKE